MKVRWLPWLVLALLVGLGPATAQAMPAAGPDGAPDTMRGVAAATLSGAACCTDCDALAARSACPLVCQSHAGLAAVSPRSAARPLRDPATGPPEPWFHRSSAPDPHPPRPAVAR